MNCSDSQHKKYKVLKYNLTPTYSYHVSDDDSDNDDDSDCDSDDSSDEDMDEEFPELGDKFKVSMSIKDLSTRIPYECKKLKLADDCACYAGEDRTEKRPSVFINLKKHKLRTWREIIEAMISLGYHRVCAHQFLEGFQQGQAYHFRDKNPEVIYPTWGS